jgi:hypothetical protein
MSSTSAGRISKEFFFIGRYSLCNNNYLTIDSLDVVLQQKFTVRFNFGQVKFSETTLRHVLKGLHHDFHRKIKKVYCQKYEDLAEIKRL